MANTRSPTPAEVMQMCVDQALDDTHTMLPGQITEWNPAQQKCSVKPLLMRRFLLEDGSESFEPLPIITDVPVAFQRSAMFFLSFPLQVGDFVTIFFAERSLDAWLAGVGTDTDPADFRRHDLTDAVAFPGLAPFAKALQTVHATNLVLGSDAPGGPQIHLDAANVHLGAFPATDFLALASLVAANFSALQARFVAFEAAVAAAFTAAGGSPLTGTAAGAAFAGAVSGAPYPAPSPVASTIAKAT